jgi:hypothetical protein
MMGSVKKAFTLSGKAMKLFFVLAAVNIVMNVINFLVIPPPAQTGMTLGKSLLVILLTVLFSLIAVFITAGALVHIKGLIKTGTAKLASFISDAVKYFARLLGVILIILLAFLIVGILFFTIRGVMPAALKPLTIAIMTLVFIVLAIFILMVPYALVGSDLSVIESIKKGILLGGKNFFKILAVMAIMFGIAVVVIVIAGIITGLLSFLLRPISGYITAIVMAIASSIMTILVNIVYMDFYLKNVNSHK